MDQNCQKKIFQDKNNRHHLFSLRTQFEKEEKLMDECNAKIKRPIYFTCDNEEKIKNFTEANRNLKKFINKNVENKSLNCENADNVLTNLNSVCDMPSDEFLLNQQKESFQYKYEVNDSALLNLTELESTVIKTKNIESEIPENMILTRVLVVLPFQFNYIHSICNSILENKKALKNLSARPITEKKRINSNKNNGSDKTVASITKSRPATTDFTKNFDKNKGEKKIHVHKNWSDYARASKNHLSEHFFRINNSKIEKRIYSTCKCAHTLGASDPFDTDLWLIDSGASEHMTHRFDWFTKYEKFDNPMSIKIGNGDEIYAYGKGNIDIETYVDKKWIVGTMCNVLFVPKVKQNLFSVKVVVKKGINFLITDYGKRCIFVKHNNVIATGSDSGTLYKVNLRVRVPKNCYVVEKVDALQLWHERLCHQNKKYVKSFLKSRGIIVMGDEDSCEGCPSDRPITQTFNKCARASKICEIIHTDLCGPMQMDSLGRKKYSIIFKDDYSSFRTIYFLREKSEVCEKIVAFCKEIKNQFKEDIKYIHSDCGKEFVDKKLAKFFYNQGINYTNSICYPAQKNGISERENKIVVEVAQCMLFSKPEIPESLWAEAMNTAVYILNRTSSTQVSGKTPFELWYNKRANIKEFKIFGTECFIHLPKGKRKILDKNLVTGYFVGYIDDYRGYRVYVPEYNDVLLSRDVMFRKEKLITNEIRIKKENQSVDDKIKWGGGSNN